jgi:hypothetical protein
MSLKMVAGREWLVVIGVAFAGAGCVPVDNPYLSLGENLDAGGEGGASDGRGGSEPGSGGTAGRREGDAGGTGGSTPEPVAGRGGAEPGTGGTSGEGGAIDRPDPGTGGMGAAAGTGATAGAGGTSGGGMNCPAIACGPEFERTFLLEDRFGDAIDVRVEVCQNESCLETELRLTRADLGPGAGLSTVFPEPEVRDRDASPQLHLTVLGALEGSGIDVRVAWQLYLQQNATNGDIYRTTVTTLDGEVLAGEEFAVNYERVEIAACTSCLFAHPAPED